MQYSIKYIICINENILRYFMIKKDKFFQLKAEKQQKTQYEHKLFRI